MKRIQIDEDIHSFLVSKAVDIGESASSILRHELHLAPPASDTVELDDDVYSFLVSRTVALGESASSILRRELHLAGHGNGGGNDPRPPASVVEFRIPAGTGNQSWNTREQAVIATVGDSLRIVNDDAVPHRLHTAGAPFPHPVNDIMPGQSADFLLATPFDPSVNGALSDHLFDPSAQFFIVVRPA